MLQLKSNIRFFQFWKMCQGGEHFLFTNCRNSFVLTVQIALLFNGERRSRMCAVSHRLSGCCSPNRGGQQQQYVSFFMQEMRDLQDRRPLMRM